MNASQARALRCCSSTRTSRSPHLEPCSAMSTQPIDEQTGRAAQVAAEAREFYEGLVAHGLIVPTEVPGAFARGPGFERVLCAFDALVQRETARDGAESLVFPPVIDRRIL